MASGVSPSRGARQVRRSRLVKPWGSSRNTHTAASRACTRGLVMGIPAVRVPAGLTTGWVRAARAVAPSAGAWLVRWAASGGPRGGDPLDVKRAPAGGEADLLQFGEMRQPPGHAEVFRVVDRGFRPQRPAQLV